MNGILQCWQFAELLWSHAVYNQAGRGNKQPLGVNDFLELRNIVCPKEEGQSLWSCFLYMLPPGRAEQYYIYLSRMRHVTVELEQGEVECVTDPNTYWCDYFSLQMRKLF